MRGGKRQGAGRKQGYAAKSAEEARRIFAEAVSKDIAPIAAALVKKAIKGDIRAAQVLFDRAWGRVGSEETASPAAPRQAIINYVIPTSGVKK